MDYVIKKKSVYINLAYFCYFPNTHKPNRHEIPLCLFTTRRLKFRPIVYEATNV